MTNVLSRGVAKTAKTPSKVVVKPLTKKSSAKRLNLVEPNYKAFFMLSSQVYDLEALRISLNNRYEVCARPPDVVDKDGVYRGLGFPPALLATLEGPIGLATEAENRAIGDLERNLRATFWRTYLDSPNSRGIGAKTLARLLGAIGDPYWHAAENRPRRFAELVAYCGHHVVEGKAPRHQKGKQANWSEEARKRLYIMADSCIKSRGGYRDEYDAWKEYYAEQVHTQDCIQCGSPGKPAKTGSPLRKGHIHMRAIRKMIRLILRDLWEESRAYHELS